MTGDTDEDYLVLTDIQGLEDFFGDMDFKVAGTHDGITAIQMDIKIHGLTRPIIEEAIAKTKEAREYILTEVMEPCIAKPRESVGPYAPKIIQIQIDPAKIGDVVGQRGKTINAIIEETGVKIDISDDGAVSICGVEQDAMNKALEYIKIITTDFEAGQIFVGKVVSIKEFERSLSLLLERRHGAYFQNRKRTDQPCGGCSDTWRYCESSLPWKRQNGQNQLQHQRRSGRSKINNQE